MSFLRTYVSADAASVAHDVTTCRVSDEFSSDEQPTRASAIQSALPMPHEYVSFVQPTRGVGFGEHADPARPLVVARRQLRPCQLRSEGVCGYAGPMIRLTRREREDPEVRPPWPPCC